MLDKSQKKAIETKNKSVLVCAGPGSGKTRTLVYKIFHLLKNNINPNNILVLTFTNKAAREIKNRVKNLLKDNTNQLPFIGTIHAFSLKIIKEYSKNKIIILDYFDQKYILKKIKARNNYKGKITNFVKYIRQCKQNTLDSTDTKLNKISSEYNKMLKDNNSFDFDDLQIESLKLIKKISKISKQYKYILVDEYLDINYIQNDIIHNLTYPNDNVFFIGDLDQSIYGFRGSNPEIFLNFKKEYLDSRIIRLEKNYRSSKSIIKSSLSLIKNNKNRTNIIYNGIKKPDNKVHIIQCTNNKDEAKYISNTIENLIGGTTLIHTQQDISDSQEYLFSNFAVLFRKNSFSKYLEGEFLHKGIPYQIVGKNSFWEKEEIRTVLLILKYICTKSKFFKEKLYKTNLDLKKIKILENSRMDNMKIPDLIDEFNIREIYDYEESTQNIDRLLNIIKDTKFSTYDELLSILSLQSRETYINQKANCVKLMTLHQTKGLEFENVFISGCEQGFIPLEKNDDEVNIEEERRLLYVGITRAQTNLYLTYTNKRLIWGKKYDRSPSRFLKEIDDKYIEKITFEKKRKKKDQIKLF